MERVLTNYVADILILIVLLSQVFTGIILHRFPAELIGTAVLGLVYGETSISFNFRSMNVSMPKCAACLKSSRASCLVLPAPMAMGSQTT